MRHLRLIGSEPWLSEPERDEWVSPGGSKCLLRRTFFGAWAGYVAIGPNHPWYGLSIHNVPAIVHGGCTWAGPLRDEGPQWWIGFDCAHGGDLQPGLLRGIALPGWEYRPLAYARRETTELAAQAEATAGGSVFIRRKVVEA